MGRGSPLRGAQGKTPWHGDTTARGFTRCSTVMSSTFAGKKETSGIVDTRRSKPSVRRPSRASANTGRKFCSDWSNVRCQVNARHGPRRAWPRARASSPSYRGYPSATHPSRHSRTNRLCAACAGPQAAADRPLIAACRPPGTASATFGPGSAPPPPNSVSLFSPCRSDGRE